MFRYRLVAADRGVLYIGRTSGAGTRPDWSSAGNKIGVNGAPG